MECCTQLLVLQLLIEPSLSLLLGCEFFLWKVLELVYIPSTHLSACHVVDECSMARWVDMFAG